MRLSRKAKRDLLWILLIVLGLGAAFYLAFGQSGYSSLSRERLERDKLLEENQRLKKEANQYSEKIDGIQSDPDTVERIVRENDYAKPNEVIVTVPEKGQEKPPGG